MVVVAVAVWLQMRSVSTPPVAPAVPPRAAAARPVKEGSGPLAPVQLAALESARQGPSDTARNPFRFQLKVAPVPVRPAVPIPGPSPAPAPPLGAAGSGAGQAAAPAIALKFIGLVEKADGIKVAVLTDGHVTMYGREGDVVDGRYKIVKIGVESVEVTHVDGRGRQTIRLTGQ